MAGPRSETGHHLQGRRRRLVRSQRSTQRRTYVNPVLDADFPDPSVLRADDGWYYAYSSQHTTVERWAHVPVARSRDLVSWEIVGDALPHRPGWSRSPWEFAWGPQVVLVDGAYVLFYSAMAESRDGMCLGAARSGSPAGPFVDVGQPLLRAPGFAAIDPMAFHDPVAGDWYLYWGGDYQPIYAQRLATDPTRFEPGSGPVAVLVPSHAPFERVVEGPYVHFRRGWYYLFYSGDRFGGDAANYAVLVARARRPIGPFEKLGEATRAPSSAILEANAHWEGPGHASIVTDVRGVDWLVYHAIDRANRWNPGVRFVRRPMLIDRLSYSDGWPRLARRTPSHGPRAAPAV